MHAHIRGFYEAGAQQILTQQVAKFLVAVSHCFVDMNIISIHAP
jgi:hypothetical protein